MPENLALLEIPVVTQENLANTIAPMNIHQRIKQRREALGLSMQALAELVGVKAWQTIQQWEKEVDGTAPKRNRLAAVASALQTTPEYLLFGDVGGIGLTTDDRKNEPPPTPIRTKRTWAGVPDGPAMDSALQDWRVRASPKSREVIDSLIERAKNNDFTDQQWELFLWLAEKNSQKNG
jgi:transcriptional regulator with XRE-family HTH domain